MLTQKQIIVIYTTFLWIQLVASSVELEKIDDPDDIHIAKKIVKYLDSKINVLPKIIVKSNQIDNGVVNKEKNKKKAYKQTFKYNDTVGNINRILIKRIVPHGLHVPKYEHDIKYNTLYKPLFRVHKKRDQYPIIDDKSNNDYAKAKHLKPHLHNDEYLLHPFMYKLHQIKSKQSFNDAGNYLNFLLKHLNGNYGKALRSPLDGRSREEFYGASVTLAPGAAATTARIKKWLPKYPPWNFWTYKKEIYEDSCPGMTINVGGVCIWVPPH